MVGGGDGGMLIGEGIEGDSLGGFRIVDSDVVLEVIVDAAGLDVVLDVVVGAKTRDDGYLAGGEFCDDAIDARVCEEANWSIRPPDMPRLEGERVPVDDVCGDVVEGEVDDGHVGARFVDIASDDDGGRVRGDLAEAVGSVEAETATSACGVADGDRVITGGVANTVGVGEREVGFENGDGLWREVLTEGVAGDSVVLVYRAEKFRRILSSRNSRSSVVQRNWL